MTGTPDFLTVPPEAGAAAPPAAGSTAPPAAVVQLRDDPLGDALSAVRLTGALFFVIESRPPWSIEAPHARRFSDIVLPQAQHVFSFHIAVEGRGYASVPGVEPVGYDTGDILVFPHGDGYRMESAPHTPPEFDLPGTIEFMRALAAGELPFLVPDRGGDGPRARTICGFLGCDARPFNPVLASLPRMLRLRRPAGAPDMLDDLIAMTMREAQSERPGGRGVSLRLSELMFVELLRRYIDAPGPKPPGWLSALADPPLARAIAAIHARPEADWSVEALAREAGLSRSALAERFAQRVGQPPARYLTLWRMQVAAGLLAGGAAPVAEVGRRVGYDSEAAFSRTFKRVAGASPLQWRRSAGLAAE